MVVNREGGAVLKKSERRQALIQYLRDNPFATDEQLAARFGVSIATIRLDRAALKIPEARERIRQVATERHDAVRALDQSEVVGEVVELQLNHRAVSVFTVQQSHVFSRTEIVRGHHLFALVNSLATAVMDADMAVTAKTELRFHRMVRVGETLRTEVQVVARKGQVAQCRVQTTVGEDCVVDGMIWVVTNPSGMNAGLPREWNDENCD
nr:transcription factor FapR [Alicyclobacillus contaminans]